MGKCVPLLNAYYLQWLEYAEKLKRHLKIYKRSSFIWDICKFRPTQLYSENVLQVHMHHVGHGSTNKSYLPYQ